MAKQKIIFDKEKSEQKKALRIPMPKKPQVFKDKTKYNRKRKHKNENQSI